LPLTFTEAPIDRVEYLRGKETHVQALARDARAQVLPVWNDLHPVSADMSPVIFGPEVLARVSGDVIFLGLTNDIPWFALAISGATPPALPAHYTFAGLRDFATLMPGPLASLVVYARAMAIWHLNHPHCSRCGAKTRGMESGHSRGCTEVKCGHRTFPRSDPAVIMLITNDDKCLLGRKPEWRPGQYSTIAGFVEPGEDIENAVRREVAEETGIKVGTVRYLASQPWPFPSSLMLGFRGEALTTDIVRDLEELEDCRWFTREEVKKAESGPGTLLLPHRSSISRWLIEGWRDE
jgi:NAD+ diphosphatase